MTMDTSIAGSGGFTSAVSETDLENISELDALGMVLRSSARSLKGRKHSEGDNEDSFFNFDDLLASRQSAATTVPSPEHIGPVSLYGVFDGHGGNRCSTILKKFIPEAVATSSEWRQLGNCVAGEGSEPGDASSSASEVGGELDNSQLQRVMEAVLLDAFRRADEHFMELARAREDLSGSTAVVAMICQRKVMIANLGDSGGLFYSQTTHGNGDGEGYVARTQVRFLCATVEKHVRVSFLSPFCGVSHDMGRCLSCARAAPRSSPFFVPELHDPVRFHKALIARSESACLTRFEGGLHSKAIGRP